MPTFDELKQQYMFSGGGITTHPNSKVEGLIFDSADRKEYFPTLRDEINRAGVEFIYVTGWWLDPTFTLDPTGGATLADLLKAKSAAGVDVRVLGWVMSPEVLRHPQVQRIAGDILNLNSDTMCFVRGLRAEPTLASKACLNILSHPVGAVHMKMVVIGGGGQAVGFTGGIDLESQRHLTIWHDVEAKVTGPVVQGFHDTFQTMWNEVKSRPPATALQATGRRCGTVSVDSHTSSMPALPARTIASPSGAKMHAQSVRTFPQFHIAASSGGQTLPTNAPLSFAPSGVFEVRDVWKQAIGAAQQMIYIEDQGFTAYDVFDWINARIKAVAGLKVILVIGGNDPTVPSPPTTIKAMNVSINAHLLAGLTAPQIDRVAFFMYHAPMSGGTSTSGPHTTGPAKFVHTKSTIVDDQWAMIGSANCMRRSLFTDFEHSVAFMDEAGVGVANYRAKLWARHLNSSIPNLATAMATFFAIPFKGSGTANPLNIDRVPLSPIGTTLKATSLSSDETIEMDELQDADSTKTWGAQVVPYMTRRATGGLFSSP